LLSRSVRILSPTSPPLAHSQCHICSVGILGARCWYWCHVCSVRILGARCPLTLSLALLVPRLLSRSVRILVVVLYPPSPSLAHSRHHIYLVRILGGGTVCLPALSHVLPALLYPLTLSRAAFAQSGSLVVVLCACLPSPAHFQSCCACLPALAHPSRCICSVGILGGGTMCPSSPPLMDSRALLIKKGYRRKEAS
jgi:hypothetical protein